MNYSIFAFYFFSLGVLSLFSLRRSFLLFCFSIVILPTSLAFGNEFSKAGIYWFEWYFPVTALSLLFGFQIRKSLTSLLSVTAVILILFSTLVGVLNDKIGITFLRDFRIIIVLFEILIIYEILQRVKNISFQTIIYLVLAAALSCLFMWLLNYLGFFQFNDEYYDQQNRTRYKQIGTEICLFYVIFFPALLYYLRQNNIVLHFRNLTLLCSLLAVIASGSRIIIVGMALAAFFSAPRSIYKLKMGVMGGIAVAGFFGVQFYLGVGRVADNMSVDGILAQLKVRFGPALSYLENLDIGSLLWGNGMGTYFFIPWFLYRGLEPEQFVIDSAHITMFVKFGLSYIIILAAILHVMTAYLPLRLRMTTFFYFIYIGFVIAFPYRPGIIGAAIILGLVGALYNHQKQKGSSYHSTGMVTGEPLDQRSG